ncbi:GDP dissociation inhibitor-domain-containing protein [Pyronema domesticum]|uniref:Similar to Rab proteins geranylgeranyltransferase component A 1 acc. no. P24386 n=1 Tax=Pyronema omphalodes (strain CBS 100304) TaxID=1076935 RepID=U4KXI9_PYROM|nr:GDP dissociation inhibitor-domain-containing protein [Pyronema domesticum]CCX06872.1 Similar to Rab proteins geranylgeranyltransferase component A 1; acc. no. P24386 [Pyronema omphalodes CBS 100304]
MDDYTLPSTIWDIIVLGTGVKPSLLSVALSRAGKKVLQLDPREYYGATETAFSIDELEQWAKSPLPPFSHIGTERIGEITRPRGYTLALAPHLVYWGSSLLELLREVKMTSSFTWQAVGSWWVYLPEPAMEERPATGIGGLLLDAGVKAVKAAAAVKKKGGWNKGRKKRKDVDVDTEASAAASEASKPTTEATETQSPAGPEAPEVTLSDLTAEATSTAPSGSTLRKLGTFREVPCTFEDVAFSPDLQDRDRGYLGGFLRFLMKCADPTDVKHQEILQKNSETSFSEFLSSEYPLPTWTIASLHSLTLLQTPPAETKLKDAVQALITHLTSIGSIPDIRSSAALTIAYGGSAELTQVWSRGTAVSGGLNVLGRGITKIVGDTVTLSNGEVVTADWILVPEEDPETHETSETESTTEATTKATNSTVSYTKSIHLISSPLNPLFTRKLETDRIPPNAAVLTFPVGSLCTSAGLTNTAPVYIIAHSSATGECGKDESVLYTSTQILKDDGGYEFASAAVRRVLEEIGSDGNGTTPEVKFVCRYTQKFPVGDDEEEMVAQETEEEEEVKGRIVKIKGMKGGLAFDEGTVESCKRVYERIIGTKEGFLRMTEQMRRQYEEIEDQ